MGIDGIHGSGGSGLPDAPTNVAQPGEGFAVAQVEGAPVTELDRVASGELSVDDYLDNRVREATNHLQSVLSPDQLANVQEQLRDQLLSDPLLTRLVQRALGTSPSEPSAGESGR